MAKLLTITATVELTDEQAWNYISYDIEYIFITVGKELIGELIDREVGGKARGINVTTKIEEAK